MGTRTEMGVEIIETLGTSLYWSMFEFYSKGGVFDDNDDNVIERNALCCSLYLRTIRLIGDR